MLLNLCQPTKPGTEELGKTRPNGGVMYPGANEQIIFLSLSLSCAHASTSKTFGARCSVKQEKKKKKFAICNVASYGT
jgi:hypothetical protein